MKSELPPPPPREGVRRLAPVEPRLVEVRPEDEEVRGAVVPALVLAPAMSLNRLVVPRVAPMLEAPPVLPELLDPLNAEAVLDDDDELEVPVLELEPPPELPEPPEPDEPPPEPPPKDRPRSLRLPRICGAITVENFCAWTVPVMRIVRCKSPIAIPAVRMTVVAVLPVEELRLVFQ